MREKIGCAGLVFIVMIPLALFLPYTKLSPVLLVAGMSGYVITGCILAGLHFYENYIEHWSPRKGDSLRQNAKIVNISTTSPAKNRYKTVITFDDGFTYTAFERGRESEALNARYIVTDEAVRKMKEWAVQKHTELLMEAGRYCNHDWVWDREHCLDRCSKCGETQEHHDWDGCKCAVCGSIRNEGHRFDENGVCMICGYDPSVLILDLTPEEASEVKAVLNSVVKAYENSSGDTYFDKNLDEIKRLHGMLKAGFNKCSSEELKCVNKCIATILLLMEKLPKAQRTEHNAAERTEQLVKIMNKIRILLGE